MASLHDTSTNQLVITTRPSPLQSPGWTWDQHRQVRPTAQWVWDPQQGFVVVSAEPNQPLLPGTTASTSAEKEPLVEQQSHTTQEEQHLRAISTQFARLIIEAMNGQRRLSQLQNHFTHPALVRLSLSCHHQRGASVGLGSVHVQSPTPEVAEVAMRITSSLGDQAAALRITVQDHRWVCTDLELG
ncbi:MAG: Rv3235 family protein [Propionibacteriaceae bacterium]|nr:Rv3235 family protein [Propionibacteriaceae bacterium]